MMAHVKNKKQKLASHSSKCDETSELAKAIQTLISGNQASLGEKEISYSLDIIEKQCRTSGLSSDHIIAMVDVIGADKFDLLTSKRLLSCLKPLGPLPAEAVVKAISWITVQKLSSTLQVRFMKWIILFYDRLDDTSTISFLYDILLEFLKDSIMCPYICQLFCKMTKKEDVNPYRIKELINLQSTMSKHPDFLKLQQVYADYRPDLMLLNGSKPKVDAQQAHAPVVVSQELINFGSQLAEIQMSNFSSGISILFTSDQRRLLFTSNLPEEYMLSFRCFVRSTLFSGKSALCSSSYYCKKENLLPILSDITSELQESIPEVVVYIESLLQTWDGQWNREVLLNFIEYWEICDYNKLWKTILQPLYKLFVVSSVEFMCSIIRCLTNLYRHWVFFELPRVMAETSSTDSENHNWSIFSKKVNPDDPEEQIGSLSIFLDYLCTLALLSNPNKPVQLLNDILRFYETVLAAHASNISILLLPPSELVMASLIFSVNPLFVSEMCGLICRYKDAVYEMKQAKCISGRNSHIIAIVNKYIIDMSNMLGLCAAFKQREDSIFQISPSFMELSVDVPQECFSIFRHPALLGLVLYFQKECEDFLHSDMLLKEDSPQRTKYLDFISSSKFSDIALFLRTFIKKLSRPS